MGTFRSLRYAQLGILLAAVVLLGVFSLAVRSVLSFRAASETVLGTQNLRVQFAETAAHLKDAYNTSRTFLANGDERLLAARQQSLDEYQAGMVGIRELVENDPARAKILARLESVVDKLLVEYDAYIAARRAGGLAAVAERAANGEGKRLGDELKQVTAEFQAEETARLEGPMQGVRHDTNLTLAILGGGVGLDLLLVMAVLSSLRRQRISREATAALLKKQSAEIHDLYNRAPCGFHSVDAKGRVLEINETELGWLGYVRDEVVGRLNVRDLLTPGSLLRFEPAFAWLQEANEPIDLDVELRRKDGTTFPCQLNSSAIRDMDGRFVATRSTVFDLTERKRVEQVVEQAKVYSESIVDTVHEPLVILTQDLHVNSANRGFYETFHTMPSRAVGQHLAEMDGGIWNIPELLSALSTVVSEHGVLKDFEVAREFPGLGPRVMLLNARKLYRIGNNTTMMLLAIEDITVRKTAEAQMRTLNASLQARSTELEAANRELEAFSYSVSHDLRAPLRHIDYFSTSLQKHLPADAIDAKAKRQLTAISDSARQMGQLIDDLLSLARVSRTELRRTHVRLDELVAETKAGLANESNGRAIAWDISPLPEVEADAALLKQVFVNLLSNAVKYTRRRPEARIEIASQPGTNGEVVVFVRDNGAGFDMKYADKLFGVFQRLHANHEFEGTGVGLANVRRIVERHGGRIWAEAEVEQGATFYFSLPAKKHAAS